MATGYVPVSNISFLYYSFYLSLRVAHFSYLWYDHGYKEECGFLDFIDISFHALHPVLWVLSLESILSLPAKLLWGGRVSL